MSRVMLKVFLSSLGIMVISTPNQDCEPPTPAGRRNCQAGCRSDTAMANPANRNASQRLRERSTSGDMTAR
ncbi:hypothetical protein Y695_02055 [Hydrogenophaga sp. T4]|nr:hypothetical protein Y695_02055 [Hydrogenophaga sp. T4]